MKNKVALITGASGGIGSEIARTLASAGYNLVLTYNTNKKSVDRLIEEFKEYKIDGYITNRCLRRNANLQRKLLEYFVKQLIKRIKKLNNSNNKSSNIQYLDFFGGSENIVSVTKNLTRVTVEVVDLEKVNLEKLRELGIGVFITGNVIKCSSAEFAEQIK